jgi:hypothetical protein
VRHLTGFISIQTKSRFLFLKLNESQLPTIFLEKNKNYDHLDDLDGVLWSLQERLAFNLIDPDKTVFFHCFQYISVFLKEPGL